MQHSAFISNSSALIQTTGWLVSGCQSGSWTRDQCIAFPAFTGTNLYCLVVVTETTGCKTCGGLCCLEVELTSMPTRVQNTILTPVRHHAPPLKQTRTQVCEKHTYKSLSRGSGDIADGAEV